MRKALFLFLIFCCVSDPFHAHAQRLGWQWAVGSQCDPGGGLDEWGSAIDNKGNIFIATWAFSPYSIFGSDTLLGTRDGQIIISKVDSSGNFQWSQAFNNANSTPLDIKVDSAGNLFLLGMYDTGSCSIDGITLIDTVGQGMSFFARFDPYGNVTIAKNIAVGGFYYTGGIDVDNAGNIYVTGVFDSNAHIGASVLTSSGGLDMFVAKYNSLGIPLWVESFGGIGDESSNKLRITPNGNMYIQVTTTSPTINFGATTFVNPSGNQTSFLIKLNNSGTLIWAKKLGTTSFIPGSYTGVPDCIIDSIENVYLTGGFSDPLILGAFTLSNPRAPFGSSAYIAKCDSSGNFIWAISEGNADGSEEGYGIGLDPCGHIWVCGAYSGLAVDGYDPMFISEYDNSGNALRYLFLRSGGDDVSGILLDKKGNFYLCGDLFEPTTFGSTTLSVIGEEITFVAKYKYFLPGIIYAHEDLQTCSPGPHILAAPLGYDSYHWNNGTNGKYDTITHDGIYIVTGTTIACNGTMTVIDTFHVTYILPSDTVYAHHDTTMCIANPITLQLLPGWTNYYWNDGTDSISHTINTNGTYWVTSISPCTTLQVRIDTFYVSYINVDTITHTMDTLICNNNIISLFAPGGYLDYQWNDGTPGNEHSVSAPGIYWVYCLPVCPGTIVSIDTFHISGFPMNLPFSLGADTFLCSSLQLNVPGNGPSYVWQDNSSGTSHIVGKTGVYYCTAYEQGCNFADTISVTIPDISQHLSDTTICTELFKDLSINANIPVGASCLWNTGSTTPGLLITAPGSYWVTVTDSICTASATINIRTENCTIVIHDVITPNGDGYNDTWMIEGIQNYSGNKVQVFDKWGDVVYEKNNYNNDWEGKGKNGALPDGTYYYLVKLNAANVTGKQNTFTGTILIKR